MASALAFCLLTVLSGCGDGRPTCVPVSGRVLIDGTPVEFGSIRITPDGQRPAQGQLGSEGRFTLTTSEKGDGCVTGTHQVTVTALENVSSTKQRWHAPKKYRQPGESGLTIEITGPTDDLEINLTWDGGKPFDVKF